MVIISNMKQLPSCCEACPGLDDYGDYPTCKLTGHSRGYNFPVREERMPDCPLVNVDMSLYLKAMIEQTKKDNPDFLKLLLLGLITVEDLK